jgi:phosphoglycolate phosphatase
MEYNMSYKLIVFDWDGTLSDSGACIVKCVQAAAQEIGIEVPTDKAIRNAIGLSLEGAINSYAPNLTSQQINHFAKVYRKMMYESGIYTPVLFAGAKEVLQQLLDEGYLLAVATGKGRRGLDFDLNKLDLRSFFITSRCADETFSKPHPQMLLEIIEELAVAPAQTLMVGDTEYDLEMAQNAKIDALAVSYGLHEKERLLQYDIKGCLADIRELPGWFESH